MGRWRWAAAVVATVALGSAAGAAADPEADLHRAFGAFIKARQLEIDAVPDLYPGGYARISLHARQADLGGMVVEEAWFRLVGVSLDPEALRRGDLRVLDLRDSAMHLRASLRNLEAYFQQGNGIKDIRLRSDGQFLYAEGTVPLAGVPAKVHLKGFFVVGGTKDVYFYIDSLKINGMPVLYPLIRRWEQEINPVFTQALWPVTFKIRSLRMTPEAFIVSSQADAAAPCLFCTGGDAPTVAP
ncbi:MAG: hypothetical protein QN141_13685 [Armatimonadota bacterium]|nr:hypothetical protein [Armatimonadota bacterium]MDR7452600.1 hypothetical protein [Armatimonadota bacterium]MDR7468239.1 hypothetical protein [Armatimonadota bacterium]MDR7495233.1 hypothetical protein [Armatimonadota bacterium]MDR7500480.1 hypothetical protein [Armatimonadota bacterium]